MTPFTHQQSSRLALALGWRVLFACMLMPAVSFASGGGEKPAAHGAKPAGGHGAKPASAHGAKPAGGHGEKKSGHGAEKKSGHGAEKKSGHGAEKKSAHGGEKKSAHGSGHGGEPEKPPVPDPTYAPELAELLHLIESKQQKNDPLKFSELDLGEYKLTHAGPGEGKMASVNFHLYAVVPDDKLAEITDKIPAHEKRLRDTILSTVHEATYEDLNEPSMTTVKARLVTSINRVLGVVEVRDAAFSNLSTKLMH